MGKKKLEPEDYWASKVWRTKSNGVEYIFARARRRYSENDVETKGPSEWIGMKEGDRFEKITDKDPDSETFGQRIDRPNSEPAGKVLQYMRELNAKNIEFFKRMCGNTGPPFGQTYYIFKFKNQSFEEQDPEVFWNAEYEQQYKIYTGQKQVVIIGEDKHNSRRKGITKSK